MSHLNNVEYLEAAQGDFDEFLAARDYKNAQAVIDNLWEQGFNHEAEIMRRAYLRAKYESTQGLRRLHVRDLDAEDEEMIEAGTVHDMRDVYDRD